MVRSQNIYYGNSAKEKILDGLRIASSAVGVTLGPGGRNVLINENYDEYRVTKDGVTVINSLLHEDRAVNIGIIAAKNAANSTVDECGDATTTTAILCYELYKEGLKSIDKGHNVIDIKSGMDKALEIIKKELGIVSKEIKSKKELLSTAFCSTNGDLELSELLANALYDSPDLYMEIKDSVTNTSYVESSNGMFIPRGYISMGFLDNLNVKIAFEKPYVLLTDQKISNSNILVPLIQELSTVHSGLSNIPGLLIIAEDVDGEALATLVLNKRKNGLKVCCIKAPDFGESQHDKMLDIASVTGAKFFSRMNSDPIYEAKVSDLGRSDYVIVNKSSTIIKTADKFYGESFVSSIRDNIKSRIDFLRLQNEEYKMENASNSAFRINKNNNRISNLEKGISTLYIHGNSVAEVKERRDRAEDALGAVRAALSAGIVPGGGSTYVHLSKVLGKSLKANPEYSTGIAIVINAILEPLRYSLNNSISNPQLVFEKVLSKNFGYSYDIRSSKIVNMYSAGVIEPSSVVYSAIKNSIATAGLLLTTECVISYEIHNTPMMHDD